jgi:hypothetical protein
MRVNEVSRPEFTVDSEKSDGPICHSLTTWFSHGEETMCPTIKPAEDHATAEKVRAENNSTQPNKVAEKKKSERIV